MTPWVIGNWKLNPASVAETQTLIDCIVSQLDDKVDCNLMVAPSFVHLSHVAKAVQASNLKLACQDVTSLTDTKGAFTGDVSVAQLKDIGVEWVIIGHSERRQYYDEDHETLLQKVTYCVSHDLGVVFCIGESETDFESGRTQKVLSKQLDVIKSFVACLDIEDAKKKLANIIIAYEPVWAIGTGKVPSVQNVESVHSFIHDYLMSISDRFDNTPIIYGGSVKPDNAHEFASCNAINGVLVGGASLNADSFLTIAKSFCK